MIYDPDKLLYAIGERVDELETAMLELAQKEADLKSWEALQATKMQGEGSSAAAAEKAVKALPAWREYYLSVEKAKVAVEGLKHRIKIGWGWWDTWRSKNSAEKRVG